MREVSSNSAQSARVSEKSLFIQGIHLTWVLPLNKRGSTSTTSFNERAEWAPDQGYTIHVSRTTCVVLAAAHRDCDPTNNWMKNLGALCQRCHVLHDRSHHLAQRWITYRRRLADGDLFLGPMRHRSQLRGRPISTYDTYRSSSASRPSSRAM